MEMEEAKVEEEKKAHKTSKCRKKKLIIMQKVMFQKEQC